MNIFQMPIKIVALIRFIRAQETPKRFITRMLSNVFPKITFIVHFVFAPGKQTLPHVVFLFHILEF